MSRTYRKCWAEGYYSNIESYVKHSHRRSYFMSHDTPKNGDVEVARDFFSFERDGRWSESGRKQGYKDDTNKLIRNDTRVKIDEILRGVADYDEIGFATKHDGKFIAWNYW